jgi:preprotein translocase subunit YajC
MNVLLAQDDAGGGGLTLLMIVALFAIFYFLLIRPQQKRKREAIYMQSLLAVGDQVVTVAGLHGTIAEMDEQTVVLETSEGIFSRYDRAAIARRIEEETDADAEPEPGSDPVQRRDKD